MEKQKTTLLKKTEIAAGTMAFEFERPAGFDFLPGQYLEIILENVIDDPRGYERDFSIASSPLENNLMIATRLRDSSFKKALNSLPLGSIVTMKGPRGSFVLPEHPTRPLVFIAGGIGVMPFRSMVYYATAKKLLASRSLGEGGPGKITLFHFNRTSDSTPFLNELTKLAGEYKNFTYVPVMTQSNPVRSKTPQASADEPMAGRTSNGMDWQGEKGYLTKELLAKYLENIQEVYPHTITSHGMAKTTGQISDLFGVGMYYIVGSPAMTAGAWQTLKMSGISDENIRTEEFAGY